MNAINPGLKPASDDDFQAQKLIGSRSQIPRKFWHLYWRPIHDESFLNRNLNRNNDDEYDCFMIL